MVSIYDILFRLTLAAFFGGLVGFERELRHKSAGFRTNILICLGSALFTIISINVTFEYTNTVADPGRIAAQIVTGVGFLGAGAIMQSRGSVIGLTTAASIWVTAAIGLAVGTGSYLAAGFVTVMTVLILQGLVPLVLSLRKKRTVVRYILKYCRNSKIDKLVRGFYLQANERIEEIDFDIDETNTIVRFNISTAEERHESFRKEYSILDPNAECVFF